MPIPSDIPRSIYAQMETGRVNPRPDELARLAKVRNIPVDYLRKQVASLRTQRRSLSEIACELGPAWRLGPYSRPVRKTCPFRPV